MILQGYIFSVIYAVLCLLLGFVAHKLGAPKKITRKLVHILIGVEWVILHRFFIGQPLGEVHFLIVCICFTLLLAFSHKIKLLPMISSDEDNSPGTVYYGVAMTIMALITLAIPEMIYPFGIGVICTSFGDGFAGLIGQLMDFPRNIKIYGNKTLFGSLSNFAVCIIAVGIFNSSFSIGLESWHIFAVALFAVELELFTGKGLDNITITVGTALLSFAFVSYEETFNYIIPILFTPIMIAFAYKKNALTLGGILSAILVDFVISIAFGNFGFLILLLFFVLGIATDKIKKKYNKTKIISKKNVCRSSIQVLANSLVASLCAVLYLLINERIFVLAFVASLGEALADTAASGMGSLSAKAFDPFRMKKCPAGLSGGMSVIGTVFSFAGAAVISIAALAFNKISIGECGIVTLCAFLGAVFDSLLGSLLQIKYKCNICGKIVEKKEHCGEKTIRYSGYSIITNDTVNFLGTLFSAILVCALALIL